MTVLVAYDRSRQTISVDETWGSWEELSVAGVVDMVVSVSTQ